MDDSEQGISVQSKFKYSVCRLIIKNCSAEKLINSVVENCV